MNIQAAPPGPASPSGGADRVAFWAERGRRIDWIEPYTSVVEESFAPAAPSVAWYRDGTLNVAANCIDRHLEADPDATALVWSAVDPAASRRWTRAQLAADVMRFANVLKAYGVRRGEPVLIYLPTCPEAVIAMLAAARIGAVHAVVFTGYSGRALAARMRDCRARVVITADGAAGADGPEPLKEKADLAANSAGTVRKMIVVRRTHLSCPMTAGRDVWLSEVEGAVSHACPPVELPAEHPLFVAYTMGVSGRPKGLVHAAGGWLVHVAETAEDVLGAGAGDLVWCTADIGHLAAQAYGVYGPLANGAATLLVESAGGPHEGARRLEALREHPVTALYTTPALARATFAAAPSAPAGEPPRTIATYGERVTAGDARLLAGVAGSATRLVETWWQTESGAILLAGPIVPAGAGGGELPAAMRPVACAPVAIADAEGDVRAGPAEGELVLTASWPGQARTINDDHLRFASAHFARFPGLFRTGDLALRDEAGAFRVLGRGDGTIHVAGHRVAAEEIEQALADHRGVVEAAVVQLPGGPQGQGLCAFVALAAGVRDPAGVRAELEEGVRARIGEFAIPAEFRIVRTLPRSRTGKIMRDLLRRAALGELDPGEMPAGLAGQGLARDLVAPSRLAPRE